METKVRLTEGQCGAIRASRNGVVAISRHDSLVKLVSLGLITADPDGKGGQLTFQGTKVWAELQKNPNRTTFEILSPRTSARWAPSKEQEEPPASRGSSLSFLNSTPPKRLTGVGPYADPGYDGKKLPDDSDLTRATPADLVVTFCEVMDSMTRTGNMTSLACLGEYAGRLWWEMTGRGVEFK